MKDTDKIAEGKQRILRAFQIEDEDLIDTAMDALIKSSNGRKFLWWLLGIGGIGRNPFASNALTTSFNCGEMNVSQKVLDRIIKVNPAGYAQMVTENANERERRDTILNGVGDPDNGDPDDD